MYPMNSRLKTKRYALSLAVFAILILSSFLGNKARAQVPAPALDGVTIEREPENPAPGQDVTVTVKSFNTDLNSATITWLKDDSILEVGVGKPSITVSAPKLGGSFVITANIKTIEGAQAQKKMVIKSGDIDLIMETSGYTPPLYKGRLSPAYQNVVKFIAIPHLVNKDGSTIDPKTLVYKWTRDYKVLGDDSGYGRQTLSIVGNVVPAPYQIKVEVSSKDQNIQAEKIVGVDAGDPSVVMYREDPLYGVLYNKAVGDTLRLTNSEVKIVAAPFSFSNTANIDYTWLVNQVEQPDLAKHQSIVLRRSSDDAGQSSISLTLRNTLSILQGADTSFNVLFSKRTGAEIQDANVF